MELNTEPDGERLLVDYLSDGRVARITFNDPAAMNAISTGMLVRLGQALDEIEAQSRVRAAFLTGAGDRAFCVGANLKERQGMTPEQWTAQHRIIEAVCYHLRNFRKPIFAAVNGLALGGGCEHAMNTDFIIASDNARFGQPEVKRGIIPGAGGTQFLPRRLPRGLALLMLMTGEMIGAEEAYRFGLVARLCRPDELQATAEQIAAAIAASSPLAIQQAKHSARLGLDSPIEQAINIEIECYQRMVGHPDRYEGVNAFNEKRAPNFLDAP